MNTRKLWRRTLNLLTSIFSILFVVTATALTIVFLQGYTIDFKQRELIKTGVLNVETHPHKADIFVNDQPVGQSNKVYPNLTIGNYTVRLEKEEYNSYHRAIPVLHGLASLIDIQLIYQDPHVLQTLALSGASSQITVAQLSDRLLEVVPPSEATGNTVIVNSYRLIKRLFDTPQIEKQTIATITLPVKTKLNSTKDLALIPNTQGTLFLLGVANKSFILDASQANQKINLQTNAGVPLPAFTENYHNNTLYPKVTWQYSGEILVVETETQLWSYHTVSHVRTILVDKSRQANTVYAMNDTDLIVAAKDSNSNRYQLTAIPLTGGANTLQVSLTFLGKNESPLGLFSNNNGKIMVLVTDQHSYLLGDLFSNSNGLLINDSDTQLTTDVPIGKIEQLSYLIIGDHRVQDVRFVDNKQFISYRWVDGNTNHLERFIYDKEQPDQITQLGVNPLYQSESVLTPIEWISNANYLPLVENQSLKLVDFSGENVYLLANDLVGTPQFIHDQPYLLYLKKGENDTSAQLLFDQLYE